MNLLSGRGGEEEVAQLSSILAPSHLVIKSATDQPQDVSQTNLTPIANEVFLFEGTVRRGEEYVYLPSSRELGEKIDAALVFALHKAGRSKQLVSLTSRAPLTESADSTAVCHFCFRLLRTHEDDTNGR